MDTYELVTINRPDAETKTVHSEIVKIVEDAEGKVENTDVWGDRRFTYHIDGYANGTYTMFDVQIPAEKIEDVTKQLSFVEDILRARIYKKEANA